MLHHPENMNQKGKNSFNIYIDLFDKGEFNEMIVTRRSDEYQVDFGDTYLGTLSHKSDNSWELINGSIPSFIIPDITRNITNKEKN
ncbi:hypothetical protein [Desertivirga xinjiangensis]|uniref:hypothetical protein n=1 Tax=Desertivirga xinjiangensis TaxID=539206 RepID=UPI00210951D7|nr:hypothetical protein [Pedobacter xinjiangensis]